MKIGQADRFKHKLTGQVYEVKVIKDHAFVLESSDSPYRMWFGEGDMELFFEMAKRKKRVQK